MAPKEKQDLDILPPTEIMVGRSGKLRSIEFTKLVMDKDYVWKLEVFLETNIGEFEMFYDVSIVLDPKKYNDQLASLNKEAQSKQLSLWNAVGRIAEEMAGVHDKYAQETEFFYPVDFKAQLLKFEKKTLGKQLIQLFIDNEAAIKISKLKENLDSAAIVLKPQTKAHNDDE